MKKIFEERRVIPFWNISKVLKTLSLRGPRWGLTVPLNPQLTWAGASLLPLLSKTPKTSPPLYKGWQRPLLTTLFCFGPPSWNSLLSVLREICSHLLLFSYYAARFPLLYSFIQLIDWLFTWYTFCWIKRFLKKLLFKNKY